MSRRYEPDGTPIYECRECEDTGFVRGLDGKGRDCSGNGHCGIGRCGTKGGTTYAHTYTRPCRCRPTNTILAGEREYLRSRRNATEKPKHDAT